jgi:hypothetical protein
MFLSSIEGPFLATQVRLGGTEVRYKLTDMGFRNTKQEPVAGSVTPSVSRLPGFERDGVWKEEVLGQSRPCLAFA